MVLPDAQPRINCFQVVDYLWVGFLSFVFFLEGGACLVILCDLGDLALDSTCFGIHSFRPIPSSTDSDVDVSFTNVCHISQYHLIFLAYRISF